MSWWCFLSIQLPTPANLTFWPWHHSIQLLFRASCVELTVVCVCVCALVFALFLWSGQESNKPHAEWHVQTLCVRVRKYRIRQSRGELQKKTSSKESHIKAAGGIVLNTVHYKRSHRKNPSHDSSPPAVNQLQKCLTPRDCHRCFGLQPPWPHSCWPSAWHQRHRVRMRSDTLTEM